MINFEKDFVESQQAQDHKVKETSEKDMKIYLTLV